MLVRSIAQRSPNLGHCAPASSVAQTALISRGPVHGSQAVRYSLSAGTLLLVAAPQPLTPPATSITLRIRLSSAAFRVLTHLAVQHAAHNRFQRPSISILLHAIAQGTLPLVRP